MEIISNFGSSNGSFGWTVFDSDGSPNPRNEKEPASPEVREAIEDFLTKALRDTDVREGLSGTWNDKRYTDPRVCDIAGHVLNIRWPKKYEFDLTGSLFERDRKRIALLNIWRKEHELAPLPLPERKTIKRLPRYITDAKLKAIELAPTIRVRAQAIADYEKLGLPALAALRERLAELPDDHSAKKVMLELRTCMACIVNEITYVKEHSAKPDEGLQIRLEALRGKPLSVRAFVKMLIETATKLPPAAEGIKLTATRSGDGSGISIVVALPTERVFQAGTQKGWDNNVFVSVGREQTLNSLGGASSDYGVTLAAHRHLIQALDEALASPPDTEFLARVSFVLER